MGKFKKPWWKRKIARLYGVLALLLVLVAVFFVGMNQLANVRIGNAGRTVWVDIQNGFSSQQIGQLLAVKGVIASAFWFRVYLWWSHQGVDLQAGNYPFHTGMSFSEIVKELKSGAVGYNTVMVTIPEGFTVAQIASLLAKDGLCSVPVFVHAVNHDRFPEVFVRQIPANPAIKYHLEGYLFPDTYAFVKGESAHQMIHTMLAQMANILTPARVAEIHNEHLTIQQALTVASMVEREARIPGDRPLIASVIFNRLHHQPPMRLRIDATVEYALGFTHGFTQNLTLSDLQVNSPYNTYLHHGLPPGPIANPGLAAIKAALAPAHTDYLYYVAKNNGSGGSYFATTYAGQLANEARSQKNASAKSH